MPFSMVGWDVGGAHLKVALLNSDAEIVQVYQQPCPLWKGLSELESAISVILAELPTVEKKHVITMTGELVDFFSSRDDGVAQIIAAMQGYIPNEFCPFMPEQGVLLPVKSLPQMIMPQLPQQTGWRVHR